MILIKLDSVALLIANPCQCNSTNRQNPPIQQNFCKLDASLIFFEIENITYLINDPDQAYPDEEGVQVGEDVPLHGEDGGEEGEEEEGGQEGEGDGQEGGQEAGDHCSQLHLESREGLGWEAIS